jgi:type I restriction enzyme S subunit
MISFSEAIYDFKYGTSEKSDYENVGTPVLRIPNIGNGICDISDLKYAVGEIDSSLRVNKNDILVIRSNGSKELVGKANLVTEEVNGYAFASYLIRIRYVGIYPEFLAFMLNSSIVRNQFFLKSKSSVGINNINTQQLASIQIPLPSYDEQVEIATILERFLSNENRIVDNILNEVDTNIMKKAILAKAFRGELGTNDSVESVDYLMRCK